MANINFAFGLRPVRQVSGRPYVGADRMYYVPASDGTALFIGDPVIKVESTDPNGGPQCTRATAGSTNRVTGVVTGVFPFNTTTGALGVGYRPASTAMYVYVCDDPDMLFEIQENASGGALPLSAVGQNASLASGSGSTSSRLSGFQLDASTVATTSTLQLSIVEFAARSDNTPASANAKVLVRINSHTEAPASAGV